MKMAIIRTIFFYFFILIIYRIMGKREIGKLSIIDLVVSLLITELAVFSIEEYDGNILLSIFPIMVLVFLQLILAYISLKNSKIRKLLEGTPSVIIKKGKINYKEMISQRYNLDDLLIQLRSSGYRSIEEIEYAILESNGNLSVFPYANKKMPLPLPLILDGKIEKDTLKLLNKDENWLFQILSNRKIEIKDIFYGFYKNKSIFIIKNDDLL